MPTISDLATQVLSSNNQTGIRTTINDRALAVADAVTAPTVFLLGTSNNIKLDAQGAQFVQVNQPRRVLQGSLANYSLNNGYDGRPSELRLMYEAAVLGGASNVWVVPTSKTVVTLMSDVTAAATTLPVSTPYSNAYRVADLPDPPTPVFGAASAVAGNFLWLFGGVDATGNTTDAIQRYSFADGTWVTSTVVLPGYTELETTGTGTYTGVAHMACHVAETSSSVTTVYLVGGSNYSTTGGTTTEEATDFGAVISLPNTGGGAAAATSVTADDTLLEVSASSVTLSRAALVFDPLASSGTGLFYVLGGWNETTNTHAHNAGLSDVVYSIAVAGFSTAGGTATMVDTTYTLTAAISGVAAYYDNATTGSEKIVVVGGQTASGIVASIDELAVPAGTAVGANAAAASITTNVARAGATAVRITGSDRVWLLGGETSIVTVPTRTATQAVEVIDTAATSPVWLEEPEFTLPGSGWYPAIPNRIPLDTARLYVVGGAEYSTALTILSTTSSTFASYRLNVGLGNLDNLIGFPTIDGVTITSINLQVDQELMTASAFTIARGADGREYDAFTISARGALGSTATTHMKWSDVTEGQAELLVDLENSYNSLIDATAAMDNIVLPWRAYADSPFLASGSNFAHSLATFCWLRSRNTGYPCIGFVATLPPWVEKRTLPSITALNTWADTLIAFDRTNNSSTPIWTIGDGVTDADFDERPDNYAFWATSDGTIPSSIPPVSSSKVQVDETGNPIDIGKFIAVCAFFGNVRNDVYVQKYGEVATAGRSILEMGHVHYAGQVSAIVPPKGTTRQLVPGMAYAGVSPASSKLHNMAAKRYTVAQQTGEGFSIIDGRTFGYQISNNNRTDYTQLSTIRVMVEVLKIIREIAGNYIGDLIGQSTAAMQTEMEEALSTMVGTQIKSYTLSILSAPGEEIIGTEHVNVTVNTYFERRQVVIGASLAGGFTAQVI